MRKAMLALAAVAAFVANASALTPKDLNPQELAQYNKISGDPKSADSFLATRDFVRKCAAVNAAPENKALAIALKQPKNLNGKYLSAADNETIDGAIELSVNAIAEKMWP